MPASSARSPGAKLCRDRRPRGRLVPLPHPDDLLDVAADEHLVWDEECQVGVAFHMVSALAVAGRVGLTAIGDSPAEAQALYRRAAGIIDAAR